MTTQIDTTTKPAPDELAQFQTKDGESLASLAGTKPLLLIFLRHGG